MQVVLFNALSSEPEDDRCTRLTGVAGGLQVKHSMAITLLLVSANHTWLQLCVLYPKYYQSKLLGVLSCADFLLLLRVGDHRDRCDDQQP